MISDIMSEIVPNILTTAATSKNISLRPITERKIPIVTGS